MKNIYTIDQIINEISLNLEDIAKSIVAKEIVIEKDNLIKLYKQQFFMEIDCNKQHKYNWHQWGILTHSRNCMMMYDDEISTYLNDWNVVETINKHLSEEIDNIKKSKLIYLGILLHDLGKFKKRYIIEPNNKVKWSFNQHELYSQQIILEELYPLLHNHYQLSQKQIEYISICARYHGLIRHIIKRSNLNYSSEFIQSKKFKTLLMNELLPLIEYKIEIGLLFFADLCAKTDVSFQHKSDIEILNDIEARKLNPKLLHAVRQKEESIEVVKQYFRIIYEDKFSGH